MKKRLLWVIIISLSSAFSAYAQSNAITDGLSWLGTQQNVDNSIGNITSTTDITRTTVAVMDTLQALNQTNTTLYTGAVFWLQSQSISTTDYLSERMFTLLSGGSDEGLLVSYIDPASGVWGGYAGYGINTLDTALALDALNAVNYSSQATISNAVLYLVTNQNPDGGWGFYTGDNSNVYMTAMVASTLEQFARTSSIATALNNAMNYLVAHQNSDGGFGSSPSTVYETALAYIALVGLTTDDTILGNAANYLSSTQASDGSWNEDAYSTALALRALYLSQNKPMPPQATTGTITGNVVDAATNQTLNNVSVVLVSDPSISTTTNSSGAFSLSNVPQGSQQVSFALSGYASSTVTVNVSTGSVINIGTVNLSVIMSTGIIKGTVTDAANGQPLGGAAITVTGSYSNSTATGANGSFIFTDVMPGIVAITASKSGYYPVTGTGTVVGGGILFFNPQLSTQPPTSTTGNITGKVLDAATSQPITGATISVSGGPSATADAQGVFLVQGITAGTYQISISASGYTSQSYQVMVSAGATTDMQTIYLSPIPTATTITGKVTDAQTGSPITGATVMVAGTSLAAKTDATGTYTIASISLLELALQASAIGYNSVTYNISTTTYGNYTVNFSLNPSQTGNLKIVSVGTDKQNYPSDTAITINATIENGANVTTTTHIIGQLEDSNGNSMDVINVSYPIPYVDPLSGEVVVDIQPLSSLGIVLTGNTYEFPPGEYKLVLEVIDPVKNTVITEAAVFFEIIPTKKIEIIRIISSPQSSHVGATATVALSLLFSNLSNIQAQFSIDYEVSTPEGAVINNGTTALTMSPVATAQTLNLGTFAYTFTESGNFPIEVNISSGGEPMTTATSSIPVAPSIRIEPSKTLTPDIVLPDGDKRIKVDIHLQGVQQ